MKSPLILIGGALLVAACSKSTPPPPPAQPEETDEVMVETVEEKSAPVAVDTQSQKPIGMANPASVYCKEQGGKLVIITSGEGQEGLCHFKDGSICEEWAFYRKECKIGDSLKANNP